MTCDECGTIDYLIYSCTHGFFQIGNKFYKRINETSDSDPPQRCYDCGIEMKEGNIHHNGCDWEQCPRCGGQWISCGCRWVFCTENTCTEWESKGCNNDHSGKPLEKIPDGFVTDVDVETKAKHMSDNNRELLAGIESVEMKEKLRILKEKLDNNETVCQLLDLVFEYGKKYQSAKEKEKRIRDWRRTMG